MSKKAIAPQNLPEALVWYYIICTYLIYLLGAHYVFAQLLACFLILYLLSQWLKQTKATPEDEKITVPVSVWVWIVAMLVIEGVTVVNHANFNLGLKRFIETFGAWTRTWGLFAFFPLIGSLKIRPQLIYRAVCIVCLQSIIIIIVGTIATLVGIPKISYVSPLGSLPVSGTEIMYQVDLIHSLIVNDYNSTERLRLFAPWSPALGITSNIYFCLVIQEQNKIWRWIGIVAAIITILGSLSRAAIICLPTVFLLTWMLTNVLRPWVHFVAAGLSFIGSIYLPTILEFFNNLIETVRKLRAGSSKARDTLEAVALYRWWNEAPIWGHGLSEPGPAWINVPIGTHHTWLGLLFTHGLVGCIAFATALFWSFIDLLIKAQNNEIAKTGLRIVLVLMLFSFSEHFDGSVYVFWPGLLMLGIAFNEKTYLARKKTARYVLFKS